MPQSEPNPTKKKAKPKKKPQISGVKATGIELSRIKDQNRFLKEKIKALKTTSIQLLKGPMAFQNLPFPGASAFSPIVYQDLQMSQMRAQANKQIEQTQRNMADFVRQQTEKYLNEVKPPIEDINPYRPLYAEVGTETDNPQMADAQTGPRGRGRPKNEELRRQSASAGRADDEDEPNLSYLSKLIPLISFGEVGAQTEGPPEQYEFGAQTEPATLWYKTEQTPAESEGKSNIPTFKPPISAQTGTTQRGRIIQPPKRYLPTTETTNSKMKQPPQRFLVKK